MDEIYRRFEVLESSEIDTDDPELLVLEVKLAKDGLDYAGQLRIYREQINRAHIYGRTVLKFIEATLNIAEYNPSYWARVFGWLETDENDIPQHGDILINREKNNQHD
jgi:hypothetical protein